MLRGGRKHTYNIQHVCQKEAASTLIIFNTYVIRRPQFEHTYNIQHVFYKEAASTDIIFNTYVMRRLQAHL